MSWFDKDKLLQDLSEKLIDGIVNAFDEYTVIFIIATYFLLVIALSIFNNVLQIINEHARHLFFLIREALKYFKGD
jgi:hypothetical protein